MTDTIPERCLGRVPHLQGFAAFIHCQLPLGHYEILLAASGYEVRNLVAANQNEIGAVLMDLSLRRSENGLALTKYFERSRVGSGYRSSP